MTAKKALTSRSYHFDRTTHFTLPYLLFNDPYTRINVLTYLLPNWNGQVLDSVQGFTNECSVVVNR